MLILNLGLCVSFYLASALALILSQNFYIVAKQGREKAWLAEWKGQKESHAEICMSLHFILSNPIVPLLK